MSRELNRHKKSDGVKWIATLVAVILLAGACATAITMGVKKNGWFEKKSDTDITTEDTEKKDDTDTPISTDKSDNGVTVDNPTVSTDKSDGNTTGDENPTVSTDKTDDGTKTESGSEGGGDESDLPTANT
jgi:flagellar basal body-associated protein FliL